MSGRLRVSLFQQGAWAAPRPSMPLAAGYLKATAEANPIIAGAADIGIVNLRGGTDVRWAAMGLLFGTPPDVIGCSVLGWNQRTFVELARSYRQARPDGLVVFGGNHVSRQGDRVLRSHPHVDLVVNGEGERTFEEILLWRLAGGARSELRGIAGVTFRDDTGAIVTTPERARCSDLDSIPSPLLTGAIPLVDGDGEFPYDVALLETNRGCPYSCAFCDWGGAVGGRVHEFSSRRLRAELELLARHQVETVVLCDANFGMRQHDLDFLEDLIAVRDRFGFPRHLETSWTKNKSSVFFRVVDRMAEVGLSSSFTLALQSLDDTTLRSMRRQNMQINDWTSVARFATDRGLTPYAELIWGAPGETVESFFAGYDELARVVPKIAVYPMLVLPNTAYDSQRAEHGLVTVRGEDDDFDYVLAHSTLTVEDNLGAQRVIFWCRVLAENGLLRWCWHALRLVPRLTQSTAIRAFSERVGASSDPLAQKLAALAHPFADSSVVADALVTVHRSPDGAASLLRTWWSEDVVAHADPRWVPLLDAALRYDIATWPVYARPTDPSPHPVEPIDGEDHYLVGIATFDYDVPATLTALLDGAPADPHTGTPPEPSPVTVELIAKVGFHRHVQNHELAVHYLARPRAATSVSLAGGA